MLDSHKSNPRPLLQVLAILEEFYVNGDIEDASTTLQASSVSFLESSSFSLFFLLLLFILFGLFMRTERWRC